jgi:hypothetical protein
MGAENKLPPENGPYSFWINIQIYYMVSPLYTNEASKSGYGQQHIFGSAEVTTKRPGNQSNKWCMAELMQ